MVKKDTVLIYSDGGCTGNPGDGGWAAVLLFPDGRVVEISGRKPDTTNNRMEITAVIEALERVRETVPESCRIIVRTDSQYLQKGMSEWMKSWIKRNWKTAAGKPVKNKDLWLRLKELSDNLVVFYEWLRGHSGDEWNERCDKLVAKQRNLAD